MCVYLERLAEESKNTDSGQLVSHYDKYFKTGAVGDIAVRSQSKNIVYVE